MRALLIVVALAACRSEPRRPEDGALVLSPRGLYRGDTWTAPYDVLPPARVARLLGEVHPAPLRIIVVDGAPPAALDAILRGASLIGFDVQIDEQRAGRLRERCRAMFALQRRQERPLAQLDEGRMSSLAGVSQPTEPLRYDPVLLSKLVELRPDGAYAELVFDGTTNLQQHLLALEIVCASFETVAVVDREDLAMLPAL